MKKVFIDTAGWLALGNKSDEHHHKAITAYQNITNQGYMKITTDTILIEVCNALRKPNLKNLAVTLIKNIQDAENRGYLTVIHSSRPIINKGIDLFLKRKDKEWSLIDCISFIVMKDERIKEALTTDHHFEQAGYSILL